MKLRRGTLVKLSKATGLPVGTLCDYAAGRVRPRLARARKLERDCLELGIDIPTAVWCAGSSEEIKGRLALINK